MVTCKNNIQHNIGILVLFMLIIPLSYVIPGWMLGVLLSHVQGDWVLTAISTFFFFLIPLFLGYNITHYLCPITWWTPLLALVSLCSVLGTVITIDFLQTGEFLGEFPVLEGIIHSYIIISFLIGGYVRYSKQETKSKQKETQEKREEMRDNR